MKAVVILCMCLSAVLCQDENKMTRMPKYDSRYDYLDVDAIFSNKRLVRAYVDCLVNGNRCTPEGKSLRKLLPEALRTKCVRCTERQKRIAVKIIRRLKNEHPAEWALLSARWDPTGDFTRYFEEFLAKEAFNAIPESGNVVPLSSGTGPIVPSPALTPAPAPQPAFTSAPATPAPTQPTPPRATPPRPLILNRFGEEGELMMGSPSSGPTTTRPTPAPSTMRPAPPPRPTQTATVGGVPPNAVPTRFTLRPTPTEFSPPYSTAITLIDEIGYKIIRTTELVADILKNTVRAVVGR